MRALSFENAQKIRKEVSHLPEEEQQTAIFKIISKNFYYYCERNLMIRDKITGKVVPFDLNWAQRIFVDMVLKDLTDEKPVRYIILKARQLGISTVIEALCFWWIATHRSINAVILAHDRETSKNLYEMFRTYYSNAHPAFQPSLKYNTKNDLTFDVEDEVKQAAIKSGQQVPGLGSKILTGVAREGVGHGLTNHFFHGSEVSRWEDSADISSGMLQTIPLSANTFAFLESTANGVGGYFYNEWQAAEQGESSFTSFFLPWYKHEEYELAAELGEGPYDDYEQELMGIFDSEGINTDVQKRKIAWSRRKRMEFKSDPKKFLEQYPHTPMVAFLASGNYAFDTFRLMEMLEKAKLDTSMSYGEIVKDPDSRKFVFKEVSEKTSLKVWYEAEKGRKYTIAVDTAEGITVDADTGKEGDWSVIDVMDVVTFKTVARWRGHIDPDQLGEIAFAIGKYYNDALIGVELNNHGLVTVQKLRNMFYTNLYRQETSENELYQESTSRFGWNTNRATKPLIIKLMKAAIRDGDLKDLDPVFIGECMIYMQDDRGAYGGKKNGHDDTVMAKAINLHLAQWSSYDVEYAHNNIQKPTSKIKKHGSDVDESAKSRIATARAARKSLRSSVKASRRK